MYPVKVSDNRRYFVDQEGAPVFWLGTTQWQLVREFALEEAEAILENARSIGFAFVQVMLLGVGDGTNPNVNAATPWLGNNPLTPNEGYFKHVDAVLELARQKNVNISLTVFHQRARKFITAANARAWARWLAERYRDVPTLFWSMTPEAVPESLPVLRELAAGLREGDGGRHLITLKPDPAPHAPGFAHDEPWLDFSCMQVWKWVETIYSMVQTEYHMAPTKPVVMAEGAYEAGSEYGFEVMPLWIRRQAYYSYLSGAHHTYGHNDSWRVLPTWREALNAPGARQLGLLKRIFLERKEWWRLVPDQSLLAGGGQTEGQVLNLAARHEQGAWAMAYCGAQADLSVDLSKLAGPQVKAFWVDPRSAEPAEIGQFAAAGTHSFSTPAGWEDALLVLESPA